MLFSVTKNPTAYQSNEYRPISKSNSKQYWRKFGLMKTLWQIYFHDKGPNNIRERNGISGYRDNSYQKSWNSKKFLCLTVLLDNV